MTRTRAQVFPVAADDTEDVVCRPGTMSDFQKLCKEVLSSKQETSIKGNMEIYCFGNWRTGTASLSLTTVDIIFL